MRFKFLALTLFLSSSLFAQLTPSYSMTKRYSVRELEQWLKKNVRPRFISPEEFNIAIQINAAWTTNHRTLGGVSAVGATTGTASNSFNPGVNIDYRYAYGRGWISARTAFRNTGGLFRGTANSVALTRANMGYHFTVRGPFICDGTIGRNSFTKIYNSQMEFSGDIDGATLMSSYLFPKMADIRAAAGAYIRSARTYWVIKAGFYNIANIGVYFDYTYAHWGSIRPNTPTTNGNNIKYNVSQFLVGWEYKPQWVNKDIQVFAALLVNDGAVVSVVSNGEREREAGYVGFQFGTVRKQNDFSIQGQLQFCRLQAIPPWNVNGIGTGARATGQIFTALTPQTCNDSTNFKGWEAILNYAVTDELTLTGKLQRSVPMNKAIGIPFNFTSFRLETQYTF